MFGFHFIRILREKIYLIIWPQKQRILSFFKFSSVLVSLVTIFSIIFYYGFENTRESHRIFFSILHFSFSFYFVKYFTTLLFSFRFWEYIRHTWFEFLVLLFYKNLYMQCLYMNVYKLFLSGLWSTRPQ